MFNNKIIKVRLLFLLQIIFLFVSCSNNDDEITETSKIPTDFIAKYSLDNNTLDTSTYENHGEITGSVFPTYNRNQDENSAMYFRTDQAYINVDDSDELNLMESYTISVWAYAASVGDGWKTILSKWGWGNGYYLGINPSNFKLRFNAGGIRTELDSPFSTNEWIHLIITHDTTDLKMYVNGSISKEASVENIMSGTHYPFRIGGQDGFGTGSMFHGAIDDVLIYDRVLTTDEINELFIGNY